MAKIKRKENMLFINVTPDATATYEKIGTDLEELVNALNMDVSSTTTILGTTSITIEKGSKTASIEPYIADSTEGLFTLLQGFIDDDSELDDLLTDVVEVKGWETATEGEYPAIKETCYIEPVSYGGDTEGYQIPYNIHYTKAKTVGTFNPTTLAFTETV